MKDENNEVTAMQADASWAESKVEQNPEETVPEESLQEPMVASEQTDVDPMASQEEMLFEAESSNLKKKLTSAATTAALVLAILMCVAVLSQVLSKGYVSIGRYSLFRVVTGSMEPAIPVGSLLVSEKVDIEEIQIGDIVNFRSKDMGMLGVTITHRVVQIFDIENDQIYLETKGDANPYSDGRLVDQQNLIGKTVYYTKEGNFVAGVLTFLTSSVGFLACIVVPCLLVGVFTMRDCVNGLREEMDAINKQLDEMEATEEQPEPSEQVPDEAAPAEEPLDPLAQQLGEEAYQELCDRLRDELLEELKQGAEDANTTEEPGADHQ